MNDKVLYAVPIGLMMFLFGITVGTFMQWSYDNAHPVTPCDCSCGCLQTPACESSSMLEAPESCSCPSYYVDSCDIPRYELIAMSVADSGEYDVDSTNCVWFANNFAAKERDYGYDAEAVTVQVNCSSGLFVQDICENYNGWHRIGKLTTYWETVSGHEIPPERYKDYGILW